MKTEKSRSTLSRRSSLKAGLLTGSALAFPAIVPSKVLGAEAPSNLLAMGFIGVGNQGTQVNMKSFLQEKDCRVVAVCDVKAKNQANAQNIVNAHYGEQGCAGIPDFRDLLARKDIDAVCISTPDHWHVPLSILSMKAGKHVISEKPTLTIAEGRELVNVQKQTGKVFTVGLEDRAVIHYYKLAEAVRNGAIGDLIKIDVGLPYKSWSYPNLPETPVPADINYPMWLGPAPYKPYTANRTDPQAWRQQDAFAAGVLTDWGMHLCDTAQVANFSERTSAVKVEPIKHITPKDSMNDVPNYFDLKFTYANGVTMNVISSQPRIMFYGTKGWCGCDGWRGQLMAHDKKILKGTYEDSKIWNMPPYEQRNFLDVVLKGAKPNYDAEDLHRLSTTLLTGSIAMKLDRTVKWDPATEEFPGDAEANALRSRKASTDWMNA
ncbi:Glycosyl hydrolase family 109 protein 1 [Pontiella desulfatans]|uniref:Glycosyl hydrolase family 109 protein 1 n=1 Tax=Pontiella desulfatans TaxID=2750659 RepID=A0A6C2TW66_PONDE|nr:Gfo/Idh/MocA family oxidoreductase [Pontiella desulfatans]VGO11908.1 Glycosyl hydrolase family 109 protein 1 [Pontiella desulfatans]